MSRKIKVLAAYIGAALIPSFLIWITGYDLPTERGWGMLQYVLWTVFSAMCIGSTICDFIKEEE